MGGRVGIPVNLLKGKQVPRLPRPWKAPGLEPAREAGRGPWTLHRLGFGPEISVHRAICRASEGRPAADEPEAARTDANVCVSLAAESKHCVFSKQLASCASLIFFFFLKQSAHPEQLVPAGVPEQEDRPPSVSSNPLPGLVPTRERNPAQQKAPVKGSLRLKFGGD